MQTICCVCHKTKKRTGWAKQEARAGIRISHGYCPSCFKEMLERVDNFFSGNQCRKTA